MKDGVILIDKEEGMTSFDAVAAVRRLFGTRQVGHTGTLDPMATGLLAVMVGRAVKASEYLTLDSKSYIATLKLGITTDTEDVTGKILTKCDDIPSAQRVKEVCLGFVGEIIQVPPMYSALKRDGKKLYELARQGITVEREGRPVTIHSLSVTETDKSDEYVLDVKCSSGTYIRTLCADIGAALGCGGAMATLRRTALGGFDIKAAATLGCLKEMSESELEGRVLPTEELFSEYPSVTLSGFFRKLAHSGCEIYQKKIGTSFTVGQRLRLYDGEGFFALGEVREYPDGTAVKPIKKFRIE